ncbi:uncharacterized protein METZ01_LOCUS456492, partial [marine metagenome]
ITYPLSEGNDVGGHTLLALAAKGSRIVVSDYDDMRKVVEQIQTKGMLKPGFHADLIRKAYGKISKHYYSLYESTTQNADGKPKAVIERVPLKEGENPYQIPADLLISDSSDELSLANFERVSGELPCFTNVADLDSILKIICSLSEVFRVNFNKVPYILIAAKHGNPCGLGIDWKSPELAIELALYGNPTAVWGGEVITNFQVEKATSQMLLSSVRRKKMLDNPNWMLDLVAAPLFDDEAIEILGRREGRKLY